MSSTVGTASIRAGTMKHHRMTNNQQQQPTTTMFENVSTSISRFGSGNRNNNAIIPTTRLFRSFTLFDNRDFLPRPFQIELYEACKNRDTIVFLRPGQGKYFISVMLVKYFSPHKFSSPNPYLDNIQGRKIFFLTKSLNSIKLYSSVFNAHSDLRIGEYLDLDGGKKWSKKQWQQQLESFDIHLMFAELFEFLLDHDLVMVEQINLLILDDVHKILLSNGNDCYTEISRKLRSKHLDKTIAKKYRILGLSASILLEDVSSKVFEKMIEQIESNLGCSCETYADLRMINKYSLQSRIKLRVYPPLVTTEAANVNDDKYKMALFIIRNYSGQFFSFMSNFSDQETTAEQIINSESIARIMIDVLEVYGTLGEWCVVKLIEMINGELYDTITLMSKTRSNYLHLLHTAYSTLRLIRKFILNYLDPEISSILEQSGRLTLKQFLSISSPKLHLLAHVLCDYLHELYRPIANQTPHSSFSFPSNICSLIYAESRSVVRVLDEWLKELAAIALAESKENSSTDNPMINCFSYLLPDHVFLAEDDSKNEVKNFYYRKHQKSLHEIYYYRQQEETLRRFRLALNCNILVTTSMSAEGLDVNRCNLVICFDPPQTFHQFIQSKGRVRVEKGQFVVLVEKNNHKTYVKKFLEFCNIEKIFTKLVPLNNQVTIEQEPNIANLISIKKQKDQAKSKPTELSFLTKSKDNEKLVEKKEKFTINTNTSTVQLTLDNAISILNHYCNKLPSDTFTKLVPNYKIETIDDDHSTNLPKFRCRLYLPINSTYRDEIVGEPKDSQSLAKQAAAFHTVKTLKDIGELDQNYYPVGKETSSYIEKLGLQDCFINTKINLPNQQEQQNQVSSNLHQTNQPQKGNRYNRIQNRNIASKRRQYYNKKVADSLCGQVFKLVDLERKRHYIQYLYYFDMKLTYRLSEEQNIRGRKIIDPSETSRTFGIITPQYLPPICDFTIYNRSGEVTVSLIPILTSNSGHGIEVNEHQIRCIENFHQYTFENVLPLGKSSIRFDVQNASNGNYLIVPINIQNCDGEETKSIDWEFIDLIWRHAQDPKTYDENILHYDEQKRFIFEESLYKDAVVIPKYRKDKLQAFYYVAEICKDLTPRSPFPDHDYKSFEEYYRLKYSKQITNVEQPLLDVDHTSARLNLLTPRFLNRKGHVLSTTSKQNNLQSKRNPQQKQILVPELCYIHPFPASFWRKSVGLPCILYRLNLLLVAEELRFKIAKEANIGQTDLPKGEKWPKLDFGWSSLMEQSCQQKTNVEKNNSEQEINKNMNKSSTSNQDLVIDTFDPSIVHPNNLDSNTNKNDAFSSMDDWSSFSTTISEPRQIIPESNIDNHDDKVFIPQIEIISGPHDLSLDDSDGEMPAIIEVDDHGNPIQSQAKHPSIEKSPTIRAGSPTYWQDQAEQEMANEKSSNFDWSQWDDTSVSIETQFCLNIEELRKELSIYMSNKMINNINDDFDDASDDFDVEDNSKDSNSKQKSNNKQKPVITSLSDLDDEDDDENDKASYSDFDLDDSSDDEDNLDYEYDSQDEEFFDDYFEDNGDFDRIRKRRLVNPINHEINNLSKTMNAYQMKSVIYDVLKIELFYDSRQIEQRNLKNYYQQRFALADQEYIRKRRLFDEMYLEEKQQVMECVGKICEQMKLNNEHEEIFQTSEFKVSNFENKLINYDKNIDEIDLKEPLIAVLMKKIDSNLLECLKMRQNVKHDNHEIRFEDQEIEETKTLNHETSNILKNKKTEVKFGELLPNRDDDLVTQQQKQEEPNLTLFSLQRQIALQTLPQWLQTKYSYSESSLELGPHPSLILQAITMSNSSDGINLERLETVGDSFLKYSITAFLFCMCPELNEGKLSFLRSRQISNINLHRLGQRINLGQLMIASKFEPVDNWCPPSYQVVENVEQLCNKTVNKVPYNLLTQHSIPNKSIADCVEALIGTYLISSGSQGAIQFMDWLGLKVVPKGMKIITKDDVSNNQKKDSELLNREKWLPQPRSPLIIPKHLRNNIVRVQEIEDKLQETYYKHHLNRFEEILGYSFKDRAYLVQAFTHNSYYENTVTDCYQRLEFLGDAVLDYLITRYLYEDSRCHSPGTLTDLRSALVNNTFFAALAVKYSFHKYLMMLSSELYRVIDGFVRKFNIYYKNNNNNMNIDCIDHDSPSNNEFNYNYWELFISENEAEHLEDIEVPKALGDIFESVAGAIFLDSGMSLEAVWKAYYPMMKPEIENFSDKVPKSPIRVLLEKQPQSVKFGKPEITSGRRIRVTVEVFGLGKFVGIGRNKRIAKCTAAKRALRALESEKRRKELERQRRLQDSSNIPEIPPCDFEPDHYQSKLSRFEIEQIHRVNLSPCLKTSYRKPLLLTQGYMQYVWDSSKKRYLDMFGGIVTTSVGHCHPRLVEVIKKQSTKLWHVSSLYLTEEMHEFCNKLANHFPEPLRCIFLCNSGSEANDIAITMSRLYTKAFDIVALRNAYHGSTLSTMPLCGIGIWKFPLPTSFGFHHVTTPDPYRGRVGGLYCRDSPVQTTRHCNCTDMDHCQAVDYYIEDLQTVLDSVLPKKIAAFFAESIQGVGGVVQFPKDYIKRAYDLIKQRDGLMVMDEVQTGFGRTGTNFWEFQAHGITPDIVTMAKGIGNGFPLAAVITTPEIANTLTLGSYFNTFGGNPLASAIGSNVLDIINEENLQKRSHQLGTTLLNKLSQLRDSYGDIVGDVRGKGLMIGIEMMLDGKPMAKSNVDFILEDCKNMGLILGRGGSDGNVFRITPPMCINEHDIEFTVMVMKQSFDNYYDWLTKKENKFN